MAQHIALYRTWRPQAFREIAGQKHIVQTLQNSLKEGRLSHAYLFSGPRGTGKTTAAKILAKAVNCERGPAPEPCNECEVCRRITEGTVVDVVEIDAASNRGVDEIRDIRDKVKYAPTEVRQKVYIIDEVHMLTTEAFNALLKTLEEPPSHVMFILATTEPHKIPATIISRCQRFDFRRVSLPEQMERLDHVCRQENIVVDHDALQYIARISDGGMRDALSLVDQITAYSGNNVTYQDVLAITGGLASEQFEQLALAIKDQDAGACLEMVDRFIQEGKNAEKFVDSLIQFFRDVLMVQMIPNSKIVTDRIAHTGEYAEIARGFSKERLFQMIETLSSYQSEMKFSTQPQTLLEIAIIKLSTDSVPEQSQSRTAAVDSGEIGRLISKIQKMEEQIAQLSKGGVAAEPASSRNAAPSRASSNTVIKKSGVKLEPYVQSKDDLLFKAVSNKWSSIIGTVKDKKITLSAWLKDAEPVSCYNDTILLKFNNSIHRETTEKQDNKQLIESVMTDIIGKPVKFVSVLTKEWQDALGAESAPQEVLQMEPEDPLSAAPSEPEHISKAIELFGEDLVTIKED